MKPTKKDSLCKNITLNGIDIWTDVLIPRIRRQKKRVGFVFALQRTKNLRQVGTSFYVTFSIYNTLIPFLW